MKLKYLNHEINLHIFNCYNKQISMMILHIFTRNLKRHLNISLNLIFIYVYINKFQINEIERFCFDFQIFLHVSCLF